MRNETDHNIIERYMARLTFFQRIKQNYGITLFKELCKNLYHYSSESNKTIIHINSEGKTFYVILNGKISVNIYLPVEGTDDFESE